MDLLLKSLNNRFKISNDKMEVIDYIYYIYSPKYIDKNIKSYINNQYSLIELNLIELESNIDNLLNDIQYMIMDKYYINVNNDIKLLNNIQNEKKKFSNGLMPYIFHLYMLNDNYSIYYTKTKEDIEKENFNKLQQLINN